MAYAGSCKHDQFFRPIAGHINFGPNALVTDLTDLDRQVLVRLRRFAPPPPLLRTRGCACFHHDSNCPFFSLSHSSSSLARALLSLTLSCNRLGWRLTKLRTCWVSSTPRWPCFRTRPGRFRSTRRSPQSTSPAWNEAYAGPLSPPVSPLLGSSLANGSRLTPPTTHHPPTTHSLAGCALTTGTGGDAGALRVPHGGRGAA